MLILAGCDVFSTRSPEDPEGGRSSFIPATTPEILFQNLIDSFSEKIAENYLACFVDQAFLNREYKFIPSAGSVSQYSVLTYWDIEAERQYFNNVRSISNSEAPIILELLNEIATPQGDSASYQYDYRLMISSVDQSIPPSYEGSLQFKIHLDNRQQWVITEWQDIKKDNFSSWSELKGRFY